MTWTRLSDDFADRPDILLIGDTAFRVHVTALIWCNRQLTDGHLPMRAAHLVASGDITIIDELIEAGTWERVEDGYQIDWRDQEDSEKVRERRSYIAQRQARYRSRRDKHAAGDHSECDPRFCSDGTGDVTRDVTRNKRRDSRTSVTHSRPGPARPDRKGGTGTGTGDAADAASGAPAPPAPSRAAAIFPLPTKADHP